MKEALEYVPSPSASTFIVGCDNLAQVEENVRIASSFLPINVKRMVEPTSKAAEIKQQAPFFRKWEAQPVFSWRNSAVV